MASNEPNASEMAFALVGAAKLGTSLEFPPVSHFQGLGLV